MTTTAAAADLSASQRRRAAAAVVLLVPPLLWGAAFPAIKLALASYAPDELAALRIVLGAALLGAIALFVPLAPVERRDWPRVAAVGLLGFPAYQFLTNLGLAQAPAGSGSLFTALVPILAALFAWWWFDERFRARVGAGLVLGVAGVWVIARGHDGLSFGSGFLWLLLAALAAGAYFALEKPLLDRYSPRAVLTYTMLVGAVASLPFAAGVPAAVRAASAEAHIAAAFLTVFPTVVAFGVMAWGLRRAPTANATSGIVLIPLVAFLAAWPLLGEIPGVLDILGGALVLGGVWLAQR